MSQNYAKNIAYCNKQLILVANLVREENYEHNCAEQKVIKSKSCISLAHKLSYRYIDLLCS